MRMKKCELAITKHTKKQSKSILIDILYRLQVTKHCLLLL